MSLKLAKLQVKSIQITDIKPAHQIPPNLMFCLSSRKRVTHNTITTKQKIKLIINNDLFFDSQVCLKDFTHFIT